MIKPIWNWITNFDSLKAIFLAIFAILGSWYDMKNQVKNAVENTELNRSLATQSMVELRKDIEERFAAQTRYDANQDEHIRELRTDIREGFKDLKGELRSRR